MDFTKKEKRLLKLAETILVDWRLILQLDPLWQIDMFVFDDDETPGAMARVNTSSAEYFIATIEVAYTLLQLKEEEFCERMNDAMCHELIHLCLIDHFRFSQTVAGDNQVYQEELKYKFEQLKGEI